MIETMPAGREIDLLVHRVVFGRTPDEEPVPSYSTDDTAAQEIALWAGEKGYLVRVVNPTEAGGLHRVQMYNLNLPSVEQAGETVPHALCRAALWLAQWEPVLLDKAACSP